MLGECKWGVRDMTKSAALLAVGATLVILAAFVEEPVQALSCHSKDVLLKSAKNNPCLDRLIEKTLNKEDKKWMESLKKTWRPRKSWTLKEVPGGFLLFDKKKLLVDSRVLYAKPLTIFLNGNFYVYRGETPSGSIRDFLKDLMQKNSKKSALFEVLFPEANAQSDNDLALNATALHYYTMDGVLDAKTYVTTMLKHSREILPSNSWLESYYKPNPIRCDLQKLAPVEYKSSDESRSFSITPQSSTRFEISGLFGESGIKKVIAEYQPSQTADGRPVFDGVLGIYQPYDFKRFHYWICENEACTQKTPLKNHNELEAQLRPDSPSAIENIGMPLENSMISMSVLSECCKDSSCRTAADDNLKTALGQSYGSGAAAEGDGTSSK